MEKICKVCQLIKPLVDFYFDSRYGKPLNRCKKCVIEYMEQRRKIKESTDPDWVEKEIERHRLKSERRRALGLTKRQSREKRTESSKKHNFNYPLKAKARAKLQNEVRQGRIIPRPCFVCGEERSEAHHEDYAKPLDVIWLCRPHHNARHNEIKRLDRAKRFSCKLISSAQ